MPLATGTRLEHYEILGPLGAGGMGEVYRASDTKLRRDVAIKVLPPQFAREPDRLARFQHEAQALAALNHPNIAAVYGLEHIDGVHFLVMELVEGQTIAERLAARRLDVSEALKIGVQIAEAVEAAHDKGIVHRDLKPANVKITPQGKVKVLDFGLAKALGDPDFAADPAHSPTLTMGKTRAGVVLGTAAYMSPEQAGGQPVDRRADVWAFGVVLYEMLAGKKAFDGKTTSHILVKVIESEPDWTALPPLPGGVQDLLERCLQKEPANRPRDIGDLKLQLQSAITKPVAPRAPMKPGPSRWLGPTTTAAAITAVLVAGYIYFRQKPAAQAPPVRFDIAQPGNVTSSGVLAISPDGQRLAFLATGADQRTKIWVRSMETQEARPLDGTEGINGVPFWSPDSRYLAFAADQKLKKIDAAGGPAQTLCELPFGTPVFGGFWTSDQRIVFSLAPMLMQVAAAGGTATPLAGFEGRGFFPTPLPGGRHFVYLGGTRNESKEKQPTGINAVYFGSLDGKPDEKSAKPLLADESSVVYAPSPDPGIGYLLFVRGGSESKPSGALMAQAINPGRLELIGEPVTIAEQVSIAGFSASSTGVLVYGGGPLPMLRGALPGMAQGQLTWFDRQGKVLSTVGEPGTFREIVLSPDATRLAYEFTDPQSNNADIWILELKRGVSQRFTFATQGDYTPRWSPDGKWIVFTSSRGQGMDWYRKPANGAGEEELWLRPGPERGTRIPMSWSTDGRFVLLHENRTTAIEAIDVTQVKPKEAPKIMTLASNPGGILPKISPDGRWFAYTSRESGRAEIYVRPFDPSSANPSAGGKWMISKGGSAAAPPFWRGDGREIFYKAADGSIMSVSVTTKPTFQADEPKPLFKAPLAVAFYEVTPDGQRFLMPVPAGAGTAPPYKVVLNWTSTLKR